MKKTIAAAMLLASVSATAYAQPRPATPTPPPAPPAAAPAPQVTITVPNPVPALKSEAADMKAKADAAVQDMKSRADAAVQDMKGRSYVFTGEQVLTVGVGAVAGYFIGSWVIGGTILPAVTTVAGAYFANQGFLTK